MAAALSQKVTTQEVIRKGQNFLCILIRIHEVDGVDEADGVDSDETHPAGDGALHSDVLSCRVLGATAGLRVKGGSIATSQNPPWNRLLNEADGSNAGASRVDLA